MLGLGKLAGKVLGGGLKLAGKLKKKHSPHSASMCGSSVNSSGWSALQGAGQFSANASNLLSGNCW